MVGRVAFAVVAALAVLAASGCAPVRPLYHLDERPGATTVDDANDVVNGRATNVTFGLPGTSGTAVAASSGLRRSRSSRSGSSPSTARTVL